MLALTLGHGQPPSFHGCCEAFGTAVLYQDALETCMRAEDVSQCLVPNSVTDALGSQFAQMAPGYVTPNGTPTAFLDHEYFKHASCEHCALPLAVLPVTGSAT